MATSERLDTLDVLRGFALLGILLVNIELFRAPVVYDLVLGEPSAAAGADRVRDFLVGWLAGGKFISSFAMLFGVGAAIIAERSLASGRSPRGVLAKRYLWLAVFGLAHMFLLFPGDVLFVYGLAGLILLAFVRIRAKVAAWWAIGLVAVTALGMTVLTALGAAFGDVGADDPGVQEMEAFFETRRAAIVEAYTAGGFVDQLRERAWEVVFVQTSTILLLPWIVGMFLVGFAIWRSGLLRDPARRAAAFRRAALIGIPLGLVLNLPLGIIGTMGAGAPGGAETDIGVGIAVLGGLAQIVSAPILAVGYLGALGWACERPGVVARLRPLRQAGRMALTGYLLQSVLAVAFFVGLGWYARLTGLEALGVVVGIWVTVLVVCSLWLGRFDRGPVERFWRRLTYGRPPG